MKQMMVNYDLWFDYNSNDQLTPDSTSLIKIKQEKCTVQYYDQDCNRMPL